ncbi:MAG: electron transfer flavoprotein subunit alpha/FixB family protein [Saprospiraceae bacterium]|nr:electron transfer flavoprotein subunit alpha/FixB family protein [Saprospiraceae bacterium]MDW8482925.1 electron transfer flavoprotein subunit alpha/FixB family protein [Saprospiraceae bacterium]
MVLVYAESPRGQIRKAAFEAVSFGRKLAEQLQMPCAAIVLGSVQGDAGELGRYGASRVFQVVHEGLHSLDSQVFTAVLAEAAQRLEASVLVLSHTSTGKTLAGRLAVRLKAGLVSGINGIASVGNDGSLQVLKPVFSGKATAEYSISSPVKVISLMGNAVRPEASGQPVPVEKLEIAVPAARVRVREVRTIEGRVPLPEAEIVVSAGRGMKDPSNWGIIEELANALGATTACSRPVADSHWRPHHEHVGQTGISIRPNLYIAVGISGAIQHLAGVNNSKVIVVINKDPEAPFFKAADYGVVGDLFEVVPRLTEAVRRFKAAQ